MSSFKNAFVAFFVSILLTSGVQGENPPASSIDFETCIYNDDGTVGETNTDANLVGNKLRTYEILCGTTAAGVDFNTDDSNGPVTLDSSTSFTTLCDLIDETPDILEYIGEGVNGHTIFAPTNAAFNKDPALLAALQVPANIIKRQKYLQLHILVDTYLTTSLECDEIFYTLNLDGVHYTQQRSKTKCAGVARSYQIGGGNDDGNLPEIGKPINLFDADEFQYAATGDTFALRTTITGDQFSADAVGCNGVIQVVDNVLLPGGTNSGKSGKSGKGEYGKGDYGKGGKSSKSEKRRELVDDNADNRIEDHEAIENDGNYRVMAYENRRRRLEALLEPNGNIELLN